MNLEKLNFLLSTHTSPISWTIVEEGRDRRMMVLSHKFMPQVYGNYKCRLAHTEVERSIPTISSNLNSVLHEIMYLKQFGRTT